MARQDVQRIGIYHGRTGGSSQLGYQGDGGGFVGSQTRTYAHGAIVVGVHRFAEDGFLRIHLEHRFRHAYLHNLVVALRRMGNHLSRSRSQTRLGSQHGRTAHAVTSGNDECRAHGSLVGKVATGLHQQADVVLFENAEFAFRLLDEFRRESDIQYLQSSQVYLVVCQHHRQLLLLQGQRQVGTDDVGCDVVGVVFRHQTRWQVDAHHLGCTLVDVFYQGRKTACQRFVQSAAKEAVYYEHAGFQLRRVEVDAYLGKLLGAFALDESLLVAGTVGRELVVDVKQENVNLITIFSQHSCHGKRIASVVAWSCENDHRSTVRPFLLDGTCQRLSGTFHEVERSDWFMLNGVFIQLMYLSTSENLHVFVRLSDYFHAKVLKKVDESMKFHDFFVILQKILYNMTMSIVKIKDKTFKTSIPEAEILKKVQVVADRLNKDYEGKTPVFLAVLNGAFIFAADLMRMITVPSEISFVKYASYEGTSSTGSMKTLMGLNQDLAGRHVVIVEDIVDSGFTMAHMIEDLKKLNPASVEVCSLLVKPGNLKVDLDINYAVMEIPNDFIVGYGLDYDQEGRNLRNIYTIVEE